eukprot:CAMPEP_0172542988 /NCGR_PEP_ID=MMETSP1067-20121228/13488_1 /TAXON_ID=265564 ORGANISM="Thalassiosira punctigera, Strain Tpunct2005C2" /NCGR_SAMPLE_ID=MMETSP1067 /ASSEMBLY_ACC=CAM_ASM_000444 /LENGTH=401 /DNA_ID=CAMNT_0013329313 /DNA_START=101 /DNA_END=1303 /DNA_ORIENTATION=+
MKLSLAFLSAAPALVSGKRLSKTLAAETDLSNVKIEAASKTGNKVLSKARRLDGDDETTWIAGYSLKFHSCTESQDYYGGYFAGNGGNQNYNGQNGNYNQGNANNGQNGNYYYGNRDDYAGMYQQKLVHFQLCPSDSCWRCKNGAEYVVELGDFVQAILEAKMTAEEYNCERVRENCYCDNANSEESCMYSCFKNAGMDSCADAMYEQDVDLQEAAECAQLEVEDEEAVMNYLYAHMERPQNQNNGYYNANGNGENQQQEQGEIKGELYVGPHCSSNGKKIHLGVFLEETCSIAAPKGIYEATHYGDSLPYSKKSMVDSGCISCMEPKEVDYQNYWDQQDPDEATEVCTNLYEIAGKCEEGLDGYYPNRDVTGCSFIKTLKSSHSLSVPSASTPAKVFAGI